MKKYFTITVSTIKGGSMIIAGYFNSSEEAAAYGVNTMEMAGYKWDDISNIHVREEKNW